MVCFIQNFTSTRQATVTRSTFLFADEQWRTPRVLLVEILIWLCSSQPRCHEMAVCCFLSGSVCWVILYPPRVGAPKSDTVRDRNFGAAHSLSEALHSLKQGLIIQSLWFAQILQPFCIGSSQIWAEFTNNRDCKNASRSSHKEVPIPSLQASVLPCACLNRKLSDMKEHEPSVKEW